LNTDELDAVVSDGLISNLGAVRLRRKVVHPASDQSKRLAQLSEAMSTLEDEMTAGNLSAQIFARMISKLEAERDTLAALPVTPEHIEWKDMGQTFGEHWSGLDTAGRHAFLLSSGVRVYVGGLPVGVLANTGGTTAEEISDRPFDILDAGRAGSAFLILGSLAEMRDQAARVTTSA
jgi:hypothetical protein